MSLETFVRRVQSRTVMPKRRAASVPSGSQAAFGAGGNARVRPRAETPFDRVAADSGETDAVDDGEIVTPDAPVIAGPDFDDPTGEYSGFPASGDWTSPTSRGGTSGGTAPSYESGGTDESGAPVGRNPAYAHGAEIEQGEGAGAGGGTASDGRLYAAGAQSSGELGVGDASAAVVTPARVAPAVPLISDVFFSQNASFALTSGGSLLAAGAAIENNEKISEYSTIESPLFSSFQINWFADATSIATNATPLVFDTFKTGLYNTFSVSPGTYSMELTIADPAIVSAIKMTFLSRNSGLLSSETRTISAKLHKLTEAQFHAGARNIVARFEYTGNGSLTPVLSIDGKPAALPAGVYTLEVEWPAVTFGATRYIGSTFGRYNAFKLRSWRKLNTTTGEWLRFDSGTGGTNDYTAAVSDDFAPGTEEAPPIEIIGPAQPEYRVARMVAMASVAFANNQFACGVKMRARISSSSAKIGVGIRRRSDLTLIAYGYSEIARPDGGIAEFSVNFFTPVKISTLNGASVEHFDVMIDTYGSAVEFAGTASGQVTPKEVAVISTTGAHFFGELGRNALAVSALYADGDPTPKTAYGRNLGMSQLSPVLEKFRDTGPDRGFSSVAPTSSGVVAVSGGSLVSSGLTPFSDTDAWTVVRPAEIASARRVYGDGAGGLLLIDGGGRLYGLGASTSGRLGFSGSSSSLRLCDGLRFVSRAKVTAKNAIAQGADGYLYGAGECRASTYNPIPQVGLTLQPLTAPRFGLIYASRVGADAWDLGGGAGGSFALIAREDGLYATGVLTGAFALSTWTRISTVRFSRVSCGLDHALLVTPSGDLHAIGSNSSGQCGLPLSTAMLSAPTFVAGGVARAFAGPQRSLIICA